jgi:hypothetical protein
LDEIGFAVYEEMSFKVKVYGWTPDEKPSQRSPCHFVTGELKTTALSSKNTPLAKIGQVFYTA